MRITSKSRSQRRHDDLGRIIVDLALANHADVILADAGMLEPDKVRRTTVSGVVDTGATRLVLPQQMVNELGLGISGLMAVRYADQRVSKRKIALDVQLKMLGRESMFTAVVEPRRKDALIGAIVLEELDLIVACARQRVVPRFAEGTMSEIE